jgi:iron-sulfur cluster assembly protein
MVAEKQPAVVFTDAATSKLHEVLKEQDALESYLRIAISSNARGGVEYVFGLEEKPGDGDQVIEHGWLKAVVDQDSLPLLDGSNIDYVEGFQRSGFVISNPNLRSGGCACGGGGCGGGGCGGHGGQMDAEADEAAGGGCACGGHGH